MQWRDCVKNPPTSEGAYVVLVFGDDEWKECFSRYSSKYNEWQLWLDGWYDVDEVGLKPSYWVELPPFPPLPNTEPLCESFCYNYCLSQKSIPRCFCKGNKNKCECKEN